MAEEAISPRLRDILDRFSELQDKRANTEGAWRLINEVIAPSRQFTLSKQPTELRARFLRNPIGILSNKRLAAFLYGDMLSPAEPWVQPKLLARDPSSEEAVWFEIVKVLMHQRLSGPGSPIATQLSEAAQDATSAGNCVTFRHRRPKEMPRIQTIPLAQCFWDEDGEGRIDTNYRLFTLTARIAARRYPHCAPIQKKASENPKASLSFVHATEPREGGVEGARADRKPFTSDVAWLDGKVLIDDKQGWDRFPFQIGRFERRAGEVYGSGPGFDAYPAVWTANAMTESVLRAAELAVDPVLFGDKSLFGGRLDRRPGAMNGINQQFAFGQDIRQLVGKIDFGGEVGIGVEMLERQHNLIEQIFYIDWLWLREGPQMTATEVNARREMRMRMMAPIVARLEQEWLNPLVEEVFFAMLEMGAFPEAPQSLAGEEIGFQYAGPLQLAQRGAYVDAIRRTFEIATQAMAFDESAGMVLRADEMLRDAATLGGISPKRMRSFEELEGLREQRAEAQALAQQMAAMKDAGGALQSGAQGIASLAGIEQQAAA